MKILKIAVVTIILVCNSAKSYCQLWLQYEDSARLGIRKKDFNKAVEFYSKAKDELAKDSLNTDSYVKVLNELARSLHFNRSDTLAKEYFIKAIYISEQFLNKQNKSYADVCYCLGDFYNDTKQYSKVGAQWLEAKRIFVLSPDKRNYANFCNKFGSFYIDIDELGKADTMLLEANQLQAQQFGVNDSDYAQSCYSRGNLYFKKNLYDSAQTLYQAARQIFYYLGIQDYRYANCLVQIGIINRMNGDNEKAIIQLQTALEIYDRTKVLKGNYAACCNSLAVAYKNKGDYEKAETFYKTGNSRLKSLYGDLNPQYAYSCNNLGNFYKEIGQYPKAKIFLNIAIGIFEKLGNRNSGYAKTCFNLANLYQCMGEKDKAKEMYLKAKQLNEINLTSQPLEYALTCNGLAAYYVAVKDYDEAMNYYSQALEIQKTHQGDQNPDYASTLNGMGVLYEKLGKNELAAENYQAAKSIRRNVLGKKNPYYGATCNDLANLYWRTGEISKADEEYKEVFDVNMENLNAAFLFTNEREKTAYIKNILGQDDKAYSFYYFKKQRSEQPYNLSLFHRNLVLTSMQNLNEELSSVNDTALLNTYNQWLELKNRLGILYTASVDERSKEDPQKLENKADELEKQLNRSIPRLQKDKITWNVIQDKLKDDEASVEFASFNVNAGNEEASQDKDSIIYVAIVLKKNSELPLMINLCSEKELSDLLTDTIHKKKEDIIKSLYSVGLNSQANKKNDKRSLYDMVWRPLENELKNVKTVYFAPAGILYRICFAAIPVNEKGLLLDKYKLVQLSSTAAIVDYAGTFINPSDTLQLYGGINYDADSTAMAKVLKFDFAQKQKISKFRGAPDDLNQFVSKWEYLDDAYTEIESIKELQDNPGRIKELSGASATEESIKLLDGKNSPAVLHIATHGFFFPKNKKPVPDSSLGITMNANVFRESDDPLIRSGLLFAGANNKWRNTPVPGIEDGILTSYEVANLYLPNTKLSVLSACETALGDIDGSEGVYGLQRAFKIAGVKNLVMSLWTVPGNETSEFMKEFYRNINKNDSVEDAFYETQKMMKEKYKEEPYNWAAWILIR